MFKMWCKKTMFFLQRIFRADLHLWEGQKFFLCAFLNLSSIFQRVPAAVLLHMKGRYFLRIVPSQPAAFMSPPYDQASETTHSPACLYEAEPRFGPSDVSLYMYKIMVPERV